MDQRIYSSSDDEGKYAPCCVKCRQTIINGGVTYKNEHWHRYCYTTSNRKARLEAQIGANNSPGEAFEKCASCNYYFTDEAKKVEYQNKLWHEECFRCCVCRTSISKSNFVVRQLGQQDIYCSDCYKDPVPRCVKCNQDIISIGVCYKNEVWHHGCFTCNNCRRPLAGKLITNREENQYCSECFCELFAERCASCSGHITGIRGNLFISCEDRSWHKDCFNCSKCQISLVRSLFVKNDADIICPECALQMNENSPIVKNTNCLRTSFTLLNTFIVKTKKVLKKKLVPSDINSI